MILVRPRVDDVANGLRSDSLDRGDDSRSARGRSCVDDHDAVLTHLDADVPSGARDHEEVGPDFHDLEAVRGCRVRGLRRQHNDSLDRRTAIGEAERRAQDCGGGKWKTTDSMSSCERHGSLAWKRSIWIAGTTPRPAALMRHDWRCDCDAGTEVMRRGR